MSDTLELAKALIARPSVTPDDAGCQDMLKALLEPLGFECQTLRFGEGADAVNNLWAVHGTEGPLFVFAGHTDVVPTGPEAQWRFPPFEPTIDNEGNLYGRGAADMKGSIAAIVTACQAFLKSENQPKGRIGFLITADEEGIAINGTVKVVEWLEQQNIKIDWCVVGEPSSTTEVGDIIKNGRRGSLGLQLKIKGRQGHVAYPHLAINPIHQAAPALAALTNELWDQGNDFFPATSFQISNINGGTGATNVIPGEVDIVANFRFSTECTADSLKARTHEILDSFQLDYEIDWRLSGEPFLTADGPLVAAVKASIREVTGRETELSTAGGTSDGRFIAPTGAQVVELGPVNKTIHQVDEHVRAEDLNVLHDIYLNILHRLLGNG